MKKIILILAPLLVIGMAVFAASTDYWAITGTNDVNIQAVDSNGDLVPGVDGTYDIGTSTYRYAEGHFDTLYLGSTSKTSFTKTNQLQFMPSEFMIGDLPAGPSLLSATSVPNLASGNSVVCAEWADGETTGVQVTFRVPADYSSGGAFRLLCDSDAETTPTQVDFSVLVNTSGTTWDTSSSNQTPVALSGHPSYGPGTPEMVTLSVSTDFSSLAAGDVVTFNFWRDDTAVGTDSLEVYYAEFYYTAAD